MAECIFCKIASKEIPSQIIYENERVVAFNDINPKADVHILIIPKVHVDSIGQEGSENFVRDLVLSAKEIAKSSGLAGYKLVFNVGREGGQEIDHLHLHLLANKPKN